MDSRTERLDGYRLKCINGLSNERSAEFSRAEGLGNDAIRAVRPVEGSAWGTTGSSRREISQTVARHDIVGGDRLQQWRGGTAA
jgi:hypothetical protein